MKVTVCFGPVSVVVPCGTGEILVRDLTDQAITRYKKASNKSSDAFIAVSALRSTDGAILDPDDRLKDVVDDREQLVACYSECDTASRGDGTSASSNSASPSPDFLASRKDIEVTGRENADLLHVRRGSEPVLIRNGPAAGISAAHDPSGEHKRWSAVPAIERGNDSDSDAEDRRTIPRVAASNFARSGARISMQIFSNGTPGYRWAEAADNALLSAASSPPDYEETMRRTRSMRREPLGSCESPVSNGESGSVIVLPNEGGPLGIHVVPCYQGNGEENGLLVQGIEPGGRIGRDGRIGIQDRIVEINGQLLHNIPFQRAQEIFRNALQSRQLALRVVRAGQQQQQRPISALFPPESSPQPTVTPNEDRSSNRVAAVSPNRKGIPLPGTRSSALMTVSSRKIGKKLDIELVKGPAGLGFSLTTRDNPAGGQCPVYIKNILPKGAAIQDGRLKPGDRLLNINEAEVTGKTQEEVVSMLRSIPSGGAVRLVVSRQDAEQESPKLPRQMKTMRASEESLAFPWKQRHILNFDIPVHDTEKAGLGISVKGKTCTTNAAGTTTDLGIFIKSVLHGGAASRDGRLQTNDQLLHVNGVPLLGRSNTEAMEVLRRAVHQEGPKPGHITLTVARKSEREEEDNTMEDSSSAAVRIGGESSSSNDHSGGSSDQSGSTVIFVSGTGEAGNVPAERNPVIERITGRQDLRNESYYRATNETWNATQLQDALNGRTFNLPGWKSAATGAQNSPTVHLPPGEVVSIDGDYIPQQKGRPGPVITSRTATPEGYPLPWGKLRPPPVDGREYGEPTSPSERDSIRSDRPSDSDAPTYASQTSLEESSAPVFSRDQIGRQSMSEKRHATLDAKSTDTYQRSKKQREERERSKQDQQQQQSVKENFPPPGKTITVAETGRRLIRRGVKRRHPLISRLERDYLNSPPYRSSPDLCQPEVGLTSGKPKDVPEIRRTKSRDLGPTLGLKKSSSLESLQTAVQEIQMREDDDEQGVGCYGYRPTTIKVVRGRGCNDSFRAAVDRSYEPGEVKEPMETLDEESNEPVVDPALHPESVSPLDNKDHMRKSKKKGSLLRGLGSMFRFGKNRKVPMTHELEAKTSPPPPAVLHERRPSGPAGLSSSRPEVDRHNMLRRTLPSNDRDRAELGRQMALAAARQAAQEEQRRIQQHYQRIMEQQQQQQQPTGAPNSDVDPAARSQRLNQLRAQHQRRHAEKQAIYSQDQQPTFEAPARSPLPVNHGRSSSYDPYNDIRKPRSRAAVGEPTSFVPLSSRGQDQAQQQQHSQYGQNRLHIELRSNGNLSPNQISQMQQVVRYQRLKVEAENINSSRMRSHQSRKQQQYHSQRSARDYRPSVMGGPVGSERPVSNYFEYESLHIAGHTIALSGPPYKTQQQLYAGSSLPRHPANPNERNRGAPNNPYASHSSRPTVSPALAGSKV